MLGVKSVTSKTKYIITTSIWVRDTDVSHWWLYLWI